MIKARTAKFQIGQIVRHRIFSFRGVIFDIDPEFNNTEEWWLSIPEEVRPHKDQPFYHLLAENSESEYVAYVSEQNLLPDDSGEPIRHSQVAEIFVKDKSGGYRPHRLAKKGARSGRLFRRWNVLRSYLRGFLRSYFAAGLAGAAPAGWVASSFLRASSARFCNSSCSFFWVASNSFGSVGGPS
jgi:heat shock protein HspQ